MKRKKNYIADHIHRIPPSGIRDFFEIVQNTQGVISLGIGEPGFVTPWHIREAAIYALEKGKTSYTSNLGLITLRRSISKYLKNFFNVSYQPEKEILVSVGVSEAIDLALRALINPGDEVLFHEPCYVSYSPSIVLSHGVPIAIPTKYSEGFSLTAKALEKKITPRSKVLILNFPTNPTGATLQKKELLKIAALCKKHDLILITDEIYSELTFEDSHTSIASLPGMKQRTIFLHGFSKAFAMTGFRIGYACSSHEIIEAMMKVHQYSMLCASIISQEAAIEALENGRENMIEMKESYFLQRNFIVRRLCDMGIPCVNPKGSFYVFPKISGTGLSSENFSLQLLEQKKVAVIPGTAFGESGKGFVRCSFSTSLDQIDLAMNNMESFLKGLR